jgi:hypothetical protein
MGTTHAIGFQMARRKRNWLQHHEPLARVAKKAVVRLKVFVEPLVVAAAVVEAGKEWVDEGVARQLVPGAVDVRAAVSRIGRG